MEGIGMTALLLDPVSECKDFRAGRLVSGGQWDYSDSKFNVAVETTLLLQLSRGGI